MCDATPMGNSRNQTTKVAHSPQIVAPRPRPVRNRGEATKATANTLRSPSRVPTSVRFKTALVTNGPSPHPVAKCDRKSHLLGTKKAIAPPPALPSEEMSMNWLFGGDEPAGSLLLHQVVARAVLVYVVGLAIVRLGKSRLVGRAACWTF